MTRAAEDPNPLPAPNQSPPSDAAPAPAVPAAASGRVRGLHPGWFASVMGTAIVAVATYGNPGNLTVLEGAAHAVGVVLAVVAYALGVVLVVAYAARWVRHTGAALADLRNPVLGGLHATLPGGLLVLAVMTSVVGPDLLPEQVATVLIATLAAIGGVLALVIGVAFGYTLFTGDPPAQSVNGSWFIPPVVTIIVPMVLAPLIPHTDPTTARLLLFLGWAGFGMGFLLFLFVMGLFHDRLVLHPLPPHRWRPHCGSVWGRSVSRSWRPSPWPAQDRTSPGPPAPPSRRSASSSVRRCGASVCGGSRSRWPCWCGTGAPARCPSTWAGGPSPSPSARTPWPP